MKMRDMVNAWGAAKEFAGLKFPAKRALEIARRVREIRGHVEDFETARDAVIKSHTIDGKVPPEQVIAANEEVAALLDQDVPWEGYLVTAHEVESLQQDTSPAILADLMPFIQEVN